LQTFCLFCFSVKQLCELIQPYKIRMRNVKEFLYDIDPTVMYDIVQIHNDFSPITLNLTTQVNKFVLSIIVLL